MTTADVNTNTEKLIHKQISVNLSKFCDRPLQCSVNLSRRQHLRNVLFDALHQLSGTHYRKLFSVVTPLQFLSLG